MTPPPDDWQEAPVQGIEVDRHGRCWHWNGPTDIVATAFPCCTGWWACRDCHDESQSHAATPWPMIEHGGLWVLCGGCRSRLSIRFHLERQAAGCHACPHCEREWNPACAEHADQYFATA